MQGNRRFGAHSARSWILTAAPGRGHRAQASRLADRLAALNPRCCATGLYRQREPHSECDRLTGCRLAGCFFNDAVTRDLLRVQHSVGKQVRFQQRTQVVVKRRMARPVANCRHKDVDRQRDYQPQQNTSTNIHKSCLS